MRLSAALVVLSRNRDDEAAWTTVYESLRPFVFAVLYRHLRGAREAAEEATQETFFRLVKYGKFDGRGDVQRFRAYLRGIALNVVRSRSSSSRRPMDFHESIDDVKGRAVQEESSERELTLKDSMVRALSGLRATDRKILLRRLCGHSYQEIAGDLGLTRTNVAVRLHRLRLHLRSHLRDDLGL